MDRQIIIKIKETTNSVHSRVENELAGIKKACQKGCDSCCHQIADVFTWEEPKVIEYISTRLGNNEKIKIAQNLEEWFKTFNENTRDASGTNPLSLQEIKDVQYLFRQKRVPCPFLLASQCAIYEARPVICRVHYVEDSAELCTTNPHRTSPLSAEKLLKDATQLFNPSVFPVAVKPLPYIVVKAFGVEVNPRPITSIVYYQNRNL